MRLVDPSQRLELLRYGGDEGSRTPTGGGLSALPLPLGYVPGLVTVEGS